MCITLCGFCGKVDVNLWKNYFYVFGLGEKGNFFQSATLYLRFSESKRRAKDFRGSDAAAKAWLYFPHKIVSSVKLPRTSEVYNLRSQTLRAARYGVLYEVKTISGKVLLLIYSNSQQDTLLRPACLRQDDFAEF